MSVDRAHKRMFRFVSTTAAATISMCSLQSKPIEILLCIFKYMRGIYSYTNLYYYVEYTTGQQSPASKHLLSEADIQSKFDIRT